MDTCSDGGVVRDVPRSQLEWYDLVVRAVFKAKKPDWQLFLDPDPTPRGPTMKITDFCETHDACRLGRGWAAAKCPTNTMAEAWAKAPNEYLLWIAVQPDVLTDSELRLFACWCVRQVWHLLTDYPCKRAVEVAEAFAVGNATNEELVAAWSAARALAGVATEAASYAAVTAACGQARYAARIAGKSTAEAAADAAGHVGEASWYSAQCFAWAAQADYLRKRYKPFGPFPT